MAGTVLYIEDNPDNMLLVRRVLEARGYQVVVAANGLDGLQQAEAVRPDLILLDINLPDIDGYEVARRLRAKDTGRLREVPIVALTANALRSDADKALAAGCNGYLAKPIDIRELWTRVGSLVPA
jgi:two-component system cell cycle response regulator DivK